MKEIDWPTFLRELSAKLFSQADEFDLEVLDSERLHARWLGFQGARAEAIRERETALGVTLPADYRGFLLASNGFVGLSGLPHGLCSLLPVEEIGPMRELAPPTGRLTRSLKDRAAGRALPEEFIVDPERFASSLLIGESDGNECILLAPAQPGLEVWLYHPETGFDVLESFTELMESALEV